MIQFNIIKLLRIIQNYFFYIKQIKHNWIELSSPNFAMTRDWFYRIGTVINLPPSIVPQYGDALIKENVKNYIAKVKVKMSEIGLNELIYVKTVKKIDDYNVKVVFGYKPLTFSHILIFFQNLLTLSILMGVIYFIINIVFF